MFVCFNDCHIQIPLIFYSLFCCLILLYYIVINIAIRFEVISALKSIQNYLVISEQFLYTFYNRRVAVTPLYSVIYLLKQFVYCLNNRIPMYLLTLLFLTVVVMIYDCFLVHLLYVYLRISSFGM